MKKICVFIMLSAFGLWVTGQQSGTAVVKEDGNKTTVQVGETEIVSVTENQDSTTTSVAGGAVVTVEKRDTTHIKIGNKGISIYEGSDGTNIKVTDMDEVEDQSKYETPNFEYDSGDAEDKDKGSHRKKFKGHWAGLELGMNNFVNSDFSMTRTTGVDDYMDLNTGQSWGFNLNFIDHGFALGTDQVGLVTGMGFEFNDYYFDGNNNITKDPVTGDIIELDYTPINLQKSKISTTYLTVPLLLEFQFPNIKPSRRMYVIGGVIGGLKLSSHSKVKYSESGDKQKDKTKDDFNISTLRYGFTGRIGYRNLVIFGNYYATPFFEKDKGPELYPVAVGLSLTF
jgi:hypothetical protein